MISEENKIYLIERLTGEVAVLNAPRQAIATIFLGESLPQELTEGTPRQIVVDALRLVMRDGWNHNPTWLERLFNNFAVTLQDQRTKSILEGARSAPPAAPDPMAVRILDNGIPFINRTKLRQLLPALAANPLKPIMVVNGDPKAGKSHSAYFIDYFARRNDIYNYKIVFDPGRGLEIGPREVAKDLIFKMGGNDSILPPVTNSYRYVQDLAQAILSQAIKTRARQNWIILDNFSGDKLQENTRKLINELATEITSSGVYSSQCRLIVINHDRAGLPVEAGLIQEEIVDYCALPDVHDAVIEILSRCASVNPTVAIDWVINALPGPPEKMYALNRRLRALLHAIQQLPEVLKNRPDIQLEEVLFEILDGLPPDRDPIDVLRERIKTLSQSLSEI